MRQPTKDQLKDQLALAAEALIQERITHQMVVRVMGHRLMPPRPLWMRLFDWLLR